MATSKAGLSRGDDLRRAKELDEARKAGLVPAAVDEHGKEINPHIPQYMAEAPWYAVDDASKPTLRHQRDWRQDEAAGGPGAEAAGGSLGAAGGGGGGPQGQLGPWYDRGATTFQATKYRKGACENCGSMTHKTTDCLERPRARGARWTDKHIAPDEKVQQVRLQGWDAKRDRWNGYDPAEHDSVVRQYERVEAMRQESRAQQRLAALVGGGGSGGGGSGGGGPSGGGGGGGGAPEGAVAAAAEATGATGAAAVTGTAAAAAATGGPGGNGNGNGTSAAAAAAAAAAAVAAPADDVRLADEEALGFGAVERRVAAPGGGATGSVRNLRIREDTAKYLLNLDVNSAHYDPKTRSMREDPLPHKAAHEKPFAGDNFVRTSGAEYEAWAALERHALQAYERGAEVHAQALPSLAETMYASFKAKKEALARRQCVDVRERYGSAAADPARDLPEGAAALADPEARRALLLGQSEAYVEYDPRSGRVVKGGGAGRAPVARSRYDEDVHPGNHASVWGSWWRREDGAWGYACCRQTLRQSYCTGAEGKAAAERGAEQMAANLAAKANEAGSAAEAERRAKSTLSNAHLEKRRADGVWGGEAPTGEGDLELDPVKLQQALKREDRRAARADRRVTEGEDEGEDEGGVAARREKLLRKRRGEAAKGGSGSDDDGDDDDDEGLEGRAMTKEEMEAYRRKRARADDPMAKGGGGGGGGVAAAAAGGGGGGYDLLE